MDDLVYICTKIARQMDAQGLDRVFDAAEAATAAIEEARPLLARVVELVDEVRAYESFFGEILCVKIACVGSVVTAGRAPCDGVQGSQSTRPVRLRAGPSL